MNIFRFRFILFNLKICGEIVTTLYVYFIVTTLYVTTL